MFRDIFNLIYKGEQNHQSGDRGLGPVLQVRPTDGGGSRVLLTDRPLFCSQRGGAAPRARHGGAGDRLREVRQRPERQQQGGRRGRGGVHPHRALLLRQRPVRGVSGPPDRDAGACEEYLQTDVLQAPHQPLQRD